MNPWSGGTTLRHGQDSLRAPASRNAKEYPGTHRIMLKKKVIEQAPPDTAKVANEILWGSVQRMLQLIGWQVRKRPIGFRPRIQVLPSVATMVNERSSTDLCRVWPGRDGWAALTLVIDCHTRELLGWHLSRSGKACTASCALEYAPIARFGTLVRMPTPF
ncbi:integrase [Pandoraea cepalis]|uniref:Integrase n=2 Tax=Pandoraea cepalis TaxID=2508294 RepID=A0A5E4Y3Z2_9BURK|nr:integrase [Pandoraea cepalis]